MCQSLFDSRGMTNEQESLPKWHDSEFTPIFSPIFFARTEKVYYICTP